MEREDHAQLRENPQYRYRVPTVSMKGLPSTEVSPFSQRNYIHCVLFSQIMYSLCLILSNNEIPSYHILSNRRFEK
jgi:hypothetical protein